VRVRIVVPEGALLLLVGPSGAGKSTFARRHFRPTEIVSSDALRAAVADDETDQSATRDAFALLHQIAGRRLARGRLTVVDATNVKRSARRPLVALAQRYHAPLAAIVFDLPVALCIERNRARPARDPGAAVVRRQDAQMRDTLPTLAEEGFSPIYTLHSPEEVEGAEVVREGDAVGGGP
jgi:predicted kinase